MASSQFLSVLVFVSSSLMEDDFTEYVILFLKDSIFRERGSDREREGEEHHVAASHAPPTGHLARNPGMCPDWELNQ